MSTMAFPTSFRSLLQNWELNQKNFEGCKKVGDTFYFNAKFDGDWINIIDVQQSRP